MTRHAMQWNNKLLQTSTHGKYLIVKINNRELHIDEQWNIKLHPQ